MPAIPVIAIFDIGKTNKKLFLFDEAYRIVYEEAVCLEEIKDEEGDACEDLPRLQAFIFASLRKVLKNTDYQVKAVNVSAYGASFVHLGAEGNPATPLYNYLKSYPPELLEQFYGKYGGEEQFSVTTASPVLGHLNSGLQLYWLKYRKPLVFQQIRWSLHLPQYISYLLTGKPYSDLTSIGCHTGLWDFAQNTYHAWVAKEEILPKLAHVFSSTHVEQACFSDLDCPVGVGLHDSSAALIPYLTSFQEPFLLLSTGTWCISLNPFNTSPLTAEELWQDCLCYLTYEGRPVKASRLFAGHEHEQQAKRLAAHFGKIEDNYKTIRYDAALLCYPETILQVHEPERRLATVGESCFSQRDLREFSSYEEAYHRLMQDIIAQQVASTQLVLRGSAVKRIFVDGGFSKNPVYMHLLAACFPDLEVFAASVAQATAMGAALAIHSEWNSRHLPTEIIELKFYGVTQNV